MQAVDYRLKEPDRFKRGKGWKVNLFGQNSDVPARDLQAFRVDMSANMQLDSHFHIVDQFQIFIAGSGTIGRDNATMITAHYADHHTGYGPLIAGDQGMSYLTLRSKTDAGLVKLSTPNVREQLKPTKRRHRVSAPVVLSIPPVLQHLEAPIIETVMEEKPGDDGMTVQVIRLGAGMEAAAPATAGTGGYYMTVLNGELHLGADALPPCSLVWVGHDEPAPVLRAGTAGVEVMVSVFPVWDDWMRDLGEA